MYHPVLYHNLLNSAPCGPVDTDPVVPHDDTASRQSSVVTSLGLKCLQPSYSYTFLSQSLLSLSTVCTTAQQPWIPLASHR